MESPTERIAITGIGLVSPLGIDAQSTWNAVKNVSCGIRAMTAMDARLPPGKDGGQAVEIPADFEPQLPREARFLKWAIRQALQSANILETLPCEPARACYMLGTTLHGMRAGGRFLRSGNHAELRDFTAGDVLRLASSDFPLRGGSTTTCSACSSSLGSIALAVTMLQSGEADLVVAGGYDTISEYAWAGFNSLRLVSDPPLRPFTAGRQGMKLAEAYAIVVLERSLDAAKRNQRPYAYIGGWGESADAHHLTQPHPQGAGALTAMRQAIGRAEIEPQTLGLIAAHATGTPDNDASERAAIVQLLDGKSVPVVGFKSHMGHTLGGAGACELILSMMSLRDQIVPACANIDPAQLEYSDIAVTHTQSRSGEIDYTLNTSLGFGGANTCIVLTNRDKSQSEKAKVRHEVVITGIGAVLPGINDPSKFRQKLSDKSASGHTRLTPIDETELEGLLNARRVRRMSQYVKLTLAATSMAVADAKWESPIDAAAILGTTHGSSGYCYDYYSQIVREGVSAANPMLFAEGVPNGAAAQLSLMLGLKRACQTIIGTRTAGLDALRLAMMRITTGQWTSAIVGAGEELHQTVIDAYRSCGLHSLEDSNEGFQCGTGAIALTLESTDSAKARGAHVYAKLAQGASASGPKEQLVKSISQIIMPGSTVIGSANRTYIDQAEQIAARRRDAILTESNTNELFGELFSAGSLISLISQLINPTHDKFSILCSDFGGLASLVEVEVAR